MYLVGFGVFAILTEIMFMSTRGVASREKSLDRGAADARFDPDGSDARRSPTLVPPPCAGRR